MKPVQLFKTTALCLALVGSGLALAEEASDEQETAQGAADRVLTRDQILRMTPDERMTWRTQQQEQMRTMSEAERNAFRAERQELMRSLTPEERMQMRESFGHGPGGQQGPGGGYGQGYQHRQGMEGGMGRGMGGGMGRGR